MPHSNTRVKQLGPTTERERAPAPRVHRDIALWKGRREGFGGLARGIWDSLRNSRHQLLDMIEQEYGLAPEGIEREVERTTGALFKIRVEEDGAVWLRIGGVANRTENDFEREGKCAKRLAATGVPLTAAIATSDGRFAASLTWACRQQPAILYEASDGTTVKHPTAIELSAFGQALGTLNREIVDAKELPSPEPLTNARKHCEWVRRWLSTSEVEWLTDRVDDALDTVAKHPGVVVGICHGDARIENAKFDGQRATLIDLEMLSRGPVIYDIACFWRRRVLETGSKGDPPHWDAFLDGYRSTGPSVEGDVGTMKAMAFLRAVWTMALPADPRADWGDWCEDRGYWEAHLTQLRSYAL